MLEARCFMVVICVSHGCFKSGARIVNGCFCFKEVRKVSKVGFEFVSREFQGSVKSISWVLSEIFKGVSRKLQKSLKPVSREFQKIY